MVYLDEPAFSYTQLTSTSPRRVFKRPAESIPNFQIGTSILPTLGPLTLTQFTEILRNNWMHVGDGAPLH